MNPQIASIHDRMANGGDWMTFRNEIATLHASALTQAEYVTLLEAFSNLVAVGPAAFDSETWSKLLPIAQAEYKTFLNDEAKEGGERISPPMLDRITAREIAAGRLNESDGLREFAEAAVILGDTLGIDKLVRPGNWLFYGTALAAISFWLIGVVNLVISPLWLLPLGFFAGWFFNEREQKAVKLQHLENRQRRGYDQ